jgi:hypothetical protein
MPLSRLSIAGTHTPTVWHQIHDHRWCTNHSAQWPPPTLSHEQSSPSATLSTVRHELTMRWDFNATALMSLLYSQTGTQFEVFLTQKSTIPGYTAAVMRYLLCLSWIRFQH